MRRAPAPRHRPLLLLPPLLLLSGCTPVPRPGGGSPGAGQLPPEEDLLVPPGFGSLRQDDITLTLVDAPVQVKVTPLEEWILRLTAPDTYERLSSLARSHASAPDRELFLVSFYSADQGAVFHPEDLHLESRGRRYDPVAVRPLTPGWGTRRLSQREAQSAVYAFDGAVDFDVDLVAEYRGVRNADWARVLGDLLAEEARARARAGGGRGEAADRKGGRGSGP